jgi:head-tail adaptor
MPKDKAVAHQFSRPITVQQLVKTADGQGGFSQGWQDYYACFADIQNFPHVRGLMRQFLYAQLYPQANTIIVIRYAPGMAFDASMQITSVEAGITKTYRIIGPPVNANRANITIQFFCREDQAKGVN